MRIEWSDRAVSDLQAISEWIERDRGLKTANRTTRSIYVAVQSLRKYPYRGRYSESGNAREFVLPGLPWIVRYRVSQERIAILEILHGAQRRPDPPYFSPN